MGDRFIAWRSAGNAPGVNYPMWYVTDTQNSGDHPNNSAWRNQNDAERRAERLNLTAQFWAEWEEKGEQVLADWLASQGFEPEDWRVP